MGPLDDGVDHELGIDRRLREVAWKPRRTLGRSHERPSVNLLLRSGQRQLQPVFVPQSRHV
jgi:hypothetical protein